MANLSESALNIIATADKDREQGCWQKALDKYKTIREEVINSALINHNMGLCYFGLGELLPAIKACSEALLINPQLWQANIVIAKAHRLLGNFYEAEKYFQKVVLVEPENGEALLGLADLIMNEFGDPIQAKAIVSPLRLNSSYASDASLTWLMASLYDRDETALSLTQSVIEFSQNFLQLKNIQLLNGDKNKNPRNNRRPRIGLISPLFCASAVFFLTINFYRRLADKYDLVIFNRGIKNDWATEEFRKIASSWHNIFNMNAIDIANTIQQEDIDILYDLGGWMDPIGLQALSLKPARKQYKWVGGQSVTTGLNCFDGWIGDSWQSPSYLKKLYTEPLINVGNDYAEYCPPIYLPKPAVRKINKYAIFSNPAKVSRAFLKALANIPGKKCFIHRQYQHQIVRDRIELYLKSQEVEYICPQTHQEALMTVNRYAVILDTFPYSSGLTAREVLAMGSDIRVLSVGDLFCERHTAKYFG